MKKKRYYYLIVFAALFIVAFKFQSFVEKPADTVQIEIKEEPEPEYNPVEEIAGMVALFDSLLDVNLKSSGTVGAAAIITYKGKIAFKRCYGVRKAGENDPIDENTIFRLASVSKTVTGVLASILDAEDIIHLDDKVVDYLPNFELNTPESTQQLTVRHLLSHTSGLIPHAYDLMVEDHVPLEKIIERLDEVPLTAAPGKIYGYQNVVYSIYDPIAKAKTHKSFDSLIEEKVFDPFGMNDASTGFEAFKNNTNKAYPHYNRGHNRFSPMRLNDRYYNTTPAAGVNASISDLGNFLLTLTSKNSEAITEEALETVFTPQVKSPLKRTYFRSWGRGIVSKEYGIGWRIVNYHGKQIAYHGGYVSGYKAEIALSQEDEIGIAILCNSPNSSTAQNIPTFLNMLFKEKEKLALKENAKNTEANKS